MTKASGDDTEYCTKDNRKNYGYDKDGKRQSVEWTLSQYKDKETWKALVPGHKHSGSDRKKQLGISHL